MRPCRRSWGGWRPADNRGTWRRLPLRRPRSAIARRSFRDGTGLYSYDRVDGTLEFHNVSLLAVIHMDYGPAGASGKRYPLGLNRPPQTDNAQFRVSMRADR